MESQSVMSHVVDMRITDNFYQEVTKTINKFPPREAIWKLQFLNKREV